MKKLSLIIAFLVASVVSYAQMYTVSGHVQNTNSQPVANQGVFVYADTNNNTNYYFQLSTTTDANGDYSVNIPNSTPNGTHIGIAVAACGMVYYDSNVYQSQNIVSNFTICSNNIPVITGQVTGNGQGVDAAIVYLIQQEYDSNNQSYTLTAIDSVYTDTLTGYYTMPATNYTNGALLVKAALIPGSPGYNDFLPTYHDSSLLWSGANPISFNNTTANIYMNAGVNPGGPGFIGGSVLQGANKSTAVGDPLEGKLMLLTTILDVPVAYTYTNADGEFSFPSLAYGTYKLFGDAWGKNNIPLTVTIDANDPHVHEITFEEHSETFEGYLWPTSVNNAPVMANITVYPNPVKDVLKINGLNGIKGEKTVALSSINGTTVFTHTFQDGEAVVIPVSGIANGLYMLQVSTVEGTAIYKIVK